MISPLSHSPLPPQSLVEDDKWIDEMKLARTNLRQEAGVQRRQQCPLLWDASREGSLPGWTEAQRTLLDWSHLLYVRQGKYKQETLTISDWKYQIFYFLTGEQGIWLACGWTLNEITFLLCFSHRRLSPKLYWLERFVELLNNKAILPIISLQTIQFTY